MKSNKREYDFYIDEKKEITVQLKLPKYFFTLLMAVTYILPELILMACTTYSPFDPRVVSNVTLIERVPYITNPMKQFIEG